jgi:hypothetical protein
MARHFVPMDTSPDWPLPLRLAFRFLVSFFAITTPYLAIGHVGALIGVLIPSAVPVSEWMQFGPAGLMTAYEWATGQLFGAGVVYATLTGYVAYLTTALAGAAIISLIWTAVDRRREYRRAHGWLQIYLRYLLATVMLAYGMVKVIPGQFPPPSLIQLITPVGDLTRMRLLWLSMGVAPAYSVFTGVCEVVGGVLLFSRRTLTLGALILVASLSNVLALNLAYGIGVQLNSTVYLFMAMVLLAPDARRLVDVFFAKTVSSGAGPVATGAWMRRGSAIAKVLVVVWIIGVWVREAYVERAAGQPIPALYGIYDVEEFTRGGTSVARGDSTRWHRFVMAERDSAAIQMTGGSPERFQVRHDAAARTLTLNSPDGKSAPLVLHYTQETDGRLLIEGDVRGDAVQAHIRAMDLTRFTLRQPLR